MSLTEILTALGLVNSVRKDVIHELVTDVYACIDQGYNPETDRASDNCCLERYGAFHMALAFLNIRYDKLVTVEYFPFALAVKKLRNLCGPAKRFDFREPMGEKLSSLDARTWGWCLYCARDILGDISDVLDRHLRDLPGVDFKLFKTRGLDCLSTKYF